MRVVTRREALLGLLAQGGPSALPRYRDYSRCLPDYLAGLAGAAYRRREAALMRLTDGAAIARRQAWVREKLWLIAGGEPVRTPLQLQTVGALERSGYRIEKLRYESQPGVEVSANLYLPAGQGPFPGVLFQMGHAASGKAYPAYQKCCLGLVKLGYVVLAFDPMGQGERSYYHTSDVDEEHSRPGRQMLLVGDTATRMQLWDAMRSLDVLASHPLVDVKRLASVGQSGGATLTMLLAAVDSRLACAVVASGNTENFACAGFSAPGSTDDAEQNLIDSGPLGLDRWDLLYPMAPKPLLVMVSERDSFGTYSPQYLRSGVEEFGKLQRVYARLGRRENLAWHSSGLPHGLSLPARVRLYEFLERHLADKRGEVVEPSLTLETEDALRVGVKAARVRFAAPNARAIDAAGLRSILRVDRVSPVLRAMGRETGEACSIETLDVSSVAGVGLPAYLFLPSLRVPSMPLVFLLEPGGRTRHWREADLCHQLAASGLAVCAFDVRGMGDLRPEVGRGNASYAVPHATEEAYAWASLILGKPMLGQRVTDVLAMVEAVVQHVGGAPRVLLAGAGAMALPMLCAGAISTAVHGVILAGGLRSWASLLETDEYEESFANFVPGILERLDVQQIEALAGPRRLTRVGAAGLNFEMISNEVKLSSSVLE